jgi:hypothetical protein
MPTSSLYNMLYLPYWLKLDQKKNCDKLRFANFSHFKLGHSAEKHAQFGLK